MNRLIIMRAGQLTIEIVGRCFKWCCVFVSLGGSEQRDFGQAVQDRKGQNQH